MALDAISKAAAYKEIQPLKTEYKPANQQSAEPAEAAVSVSEELTKGSTDKDSKSSKEGQHLREVMKQVKRKGSFGQTNAQFSYHEATNRIIIKLLDNETNEVIKEIPPERTLELISKMQEIAGIMIDEKG